MIEIIRAARSIIPAAELNWNYPSSMLYHTCRGTNISVPPYIFILKGAQTPPFDNFQAKYSSFSESRYDDPSQTKIREKNILFVGMLRFTISFLVRALSKYWPSFAIWSSVYFTLIVFSNWPEEDKWKLCKLYWLPRCLMRIDDHKDASGRLEIAKNCTGQDLTSNFKKIFLKF